MKQIYSELKRRNVFRVAAAYLVLCWLLLQVGDILFEALELPAWSIRMLVALLALGVVPTVVFAWAYELTPEGVKKESEIDRSESITPETGRKLDFVTIGLLVVAMVLFVTEDLWRGMVSGPSAGPIAEDRSGPRRSVPGGRPAEDGVSIAVLSFANMSPDADNEYFADGVSEEILNLLADVEDLSIASRTSSFGYKGKDTPIPEIASALNVRYVLEGSVRKVGDQVRVTAQLIDARTDRHVWSNTFDRTLEDIFAIQDEIAAAIGDALQVELLGTEGETVKAQEIDPEIYAQFLEARHLLRQRTPESMRRANEMLIQIVEGEPEFARAHVVLGEAYLLNRNISQARPLVPGAVALARARSHAETARSLDPQLSGIDLILGAIAEESGDPSTAMDHFNRATALEPREPRPYHWRGMLLCQAGYLDRGIADLETARQLDPANPNASFATVDCLISRGEFDRAREVLRTVISPGSPRGRGLVAITELESGNPEAAAAVIREMIRLGQDAKLHGQFIKIIELGSADSVALASDAIQGPDDRGLALALGQTDAFFENLSSLAATPTIPGIWLARHRDVRRDPRFFEAMKRFGIVDLWRKLRPPPDCRADGETFTCGHGSRTGGIEP